MLPLSKPQSASEDDEQIAVSLKDTDQLIGDLFAHFEEDTVSVGWNFDPAYAGQGYALESARALFAHLFDNLRARRLYAYVEDHNHPSQKLCERLGMRKEGLFLDYVSFRNDDAGQPIYENTMAIRSASPGMGELSSKFATPLAVMAALNRSFVSLSGERLSTLRAFF